MSIKTCITNLRTAGHITLEEAQRLEKRFDRLLREVQAPGPARDRMVAELRAEKQEKERLALITETVRRRLDGDLDQYRDSKGRADLGAAVIAALEHRGQAPYADVETRRLTILGQSHAKLETLLHEFRRGAMRGDARRVRNADVRADLENVVRELFGESTNDAKASALARAWEQVSDDLRQRFNYAGGQIGKLEKWGLPQHHDSEAMLRAGFQKWRDYIAPRLDMDRMRSPLTGEKMTGDEIEEALHVIWSRASTDGWIDREPTGAVTGIGMLAKQHADHRFLHFKDAAAWLEYQTQFGQADPYNAMMGYVATMARDIAAMEVLGPNPKAMLEYQKQRIMRAAQVGGKTLYDREMGQAVAFGGGEQSVDAARSQIKTIDDMWAHISGSANVPVNGRVANVLSASRNVISAASLGSAAVSAISDASFGAMARMFNGVPLTGFASQFVRSFGPATRREAVRAGLILDSALNAVHGQSRYLGSISGREWTSYINDRVLTYSGLLTWTQAGKHAFGLEVQAAIADELGKGFGDVQPALRRMMERHGVTRDDWAALSNVPLYEPQPGATFLRPAEIETAAGRELAEKYLAMILRETRYAVPETTVRSRVGMLGTNQPGTLVGEVLRTAGQFKSFGLTVLMLQAEMLHTQVAGGGLARGAAYAGSMLIATTILGGVAMQLKNIAAGRDPQRMDPMDKAGAKFWGAAMLQGGGLGIYGDFFFSDVNRFGSSLAGTLAGPAVDRLDTLRKLTIGNAIEAAQGKKTHFGREALAFAQQNMPGGSLWYARLAWERVVIDQMRYLVDPDAYSAFRRRMSSRQRDYGQEYWWKPGQSAPSRPPNLGAVGGR